MTGAGLEGEGFLSGLEVSWSAERVRTGLNATGWWTPASSATRRYQIN